jgi:uncharacterized lipoprotein NlpE involved in copper resistance
MKNKIFVALLCTIYLLLAGCSAQKKTAGNYTYKTECLGIEMDGSQTVKTWGNGKNRFDAIEQAKKNAVRDVLFNGILEGKSDCEKRPVVSEVNAQVKYETYFNKFFTDKGEYKDYISMKDTQLGVREIKGARESVTIGVVVRVLRPELKQKMIADGILK